MNAVTAASPQAHVHVRVGRCDIAVPIEQVLQALPMPAQGLTALPRRTGALLGLIEAAGAAVPVVALDRWLPMPAGEAAAAPRVLVLRQAGQLVAVQVDALQGVKALDPAAVRRVHHGDDDSELFEAVLPATEHSPTLCLLEVARLMRLSRAWCGEAGQAADADALPQEAEVQREAPSPSTAQDRRHAVFQIGGELWAVPAASLGQVVAVPATELALNRGELSYAISQWRGRKLPLVDISPGRQLGGTAAAPWMALLNQGPLCLGLSVSACRQLLDLPESAIAATPTDRLRAGIAVLPALGQVQVLDPAKLFRLTPEAAISHQAPAVTRLAASPTDDLEPHPYLVFEADQVYATPVKGILGVIELPQPVQAELLAGARSVMAWRGRSIHVVKLPPIGGPGAAIYPRLAVLVQPDADTPPLGIAIQRLCDWLPAHSAQRSGMRMGAMGELALIHAKGSPEHASLVVVDLAQLAYLLG